MATSDRGQPQLAGNISRPADVQPGEDELVTSLPVDSRSVDAFKKTERRLQEYDPRYHDLFDQMVAGFALHEAILDASGRLCDYRFIDVNPAFETMTGLRRSDVLGRTIREVLPEIEPRWIAVYESVVNSGEPAHFVDYTAELDRHYDVVAYRPQPGQFATSFSDVSDRIRAEQRLRESEERFRQTVENTSSGYFRVDAQGRFSDVNRAWLAMHGYESADAVLGHDIGLTQTPDDLVTARAIVSRLLAGESFPTGEFSRQLRDGSIGYHRFSAHPIFQNGQVVGAEGFLIDVTEQRRTGDLLKKSEERYRGIFENVGNGVIECTIDGRYLRVNERFSEIVGYSESELLRLTWMDITHPDDVDADVDSIERLIAGEFPRLAMDKRFIRKDGAIVWVSQQVSTIRESSGRPIRLVGTSQDITERRRAAQTIQVQHDLAVALSATTSQGEALDLVLDAALAVAELDSGGVYVVDPVTGALNLVTWRGLGEDFVRANAHCLPGSPKERLVAAGSTVYLPNLASPDGEAFTAQARVVEGLRAVIAVPVVDRERVVACLNLASHVRDEIPPDVRIAIEAIAAQSGSAIGRIRGEEALRESEARYRVYTNGAPNGIFVSDSAGRYVDVNPTAERITGYSRDELLAMSVSDLIAPDDQQTVRREFARLVTDGAVNCQLRFLRKGGEERWWEVRANRIAEDRYLGFTTDITERVRAEEALRDSAQRQGVLIEQTPLAVIEWTTDSRITRWNSRAEALFGYPAEEAIGRNGLFLVPNAIRPSIAAAGDDLVAGRGGRRSTNENLTRDGRTILCEWYNSPLKSADGTVIGIASLVEDITERAAAESALRDSEERYRDFFEHSPVPTWEEDYSAVRSFARTLRSAGVRDLRAHFATHSEDLRRCADLIRVVEVNPAGLRFYGANDKREFLAKFGLQFESEQDLTSFADEIATLVDGGMQFEAEKEARIISGDVRSVILRISAISGHERALDRVLVSFIDITERRRAEAILHANQTRLSALAELGQSSDLSVRQLCDFALERSIELTNSEVGYLFFYSETEAEFTVYAWSEKALRQCRILDRQAIYSLANTGLWGEAVRQRRPVITNDCGAPSPWKRGLPLGHVPITRHLNLPIFEQGKIVAVIGVANKVKPYDEVDVQQLTLLMEGVWRLIERTHRDEALKRYNQRLSLLQELDRRILAAQSAEEIANFAVRQVRAAISSDEVLLVLFDQSDGVARALAHDHVPTWADHLHEIRPLTDFARPDDDVRIPRYYPDITRLSAPDQAMRNAAEKGVRSVLTAPLVVADEQLGLLNLASARVDAFSAEQREMASEVANQIAIGLQQARLREELRQHSAELERRVKDRTRQLSEANAELDSFAYSVSHDLRAPLRALQAYSDILLEEHTASLDDDGRNFVRRINGAAKRMDTLVRDVLAFSRATRFDGDFEPVGLSLALKEARLQIEAEISGKGTRIEVEGDLPFVRANRTVLVRAIANLLSNAVKFVAEGVAPRVRIHAESRGETVRLWITDNGIGIATENQERIFSAFERLHGIEEYPGSGIGLAIVRKGVERMAGSVGVESALGHGSRFWIELPIV